MFPQITPTTEDQVFEICDPVGGLFIQSTTVLEQLALRYLNNRILLLLLLAFGIPHTFNFYIYSKPRIH